MIKFLFLKNDQKFHEWLASKKNGTIIQKIGQQHNKMYPKDMDIGQLIVQFGHPMSSSFLPIGKLF